LALDHASHSAATFDFTGNGSVSLRLIDLKDIAFGSGTTDSYIGTPLAVLCRLPMPNMTPRASRFLGLYKFDILISSDGNGGTLVVDPDVAHSLVGGTFCSANRIRQAIIRSAFHRRMAVRAIWGALRSIPSITANGQESVGCSLIWIPIPSPRLLRSHTCPPLASSANGGTTVPRPNRSRCGRRAGNDTFIFKPGFGADVIAMPPS